MAIMTPVVNVLLDTFPGLSLPPTVCLPLPVVASTAELLESIRVLLPPGLSRDARFIVYSTSSQPVLESSTTTLQDLVPASSGQENVSAAILPLRLYTPLVGGKGGFGSQLRAAGGRMSSRKRRQNAELATGSARNLDGRRLRTVTEAKNLAAYLATKPEMDRREKEERRKRWEAVIEMAEQREADMRAGKGPDGRRKGLSGEWVEEKEEVGEGVRNAVKLAMMADEKEKGQGHMSPEEDSSGSGGSRPGTEDEDSEPEDVMELDEEGMSRLRAEAEMGDVDAIWVLKHRLKIPVDLFPPERKQERRFAGFDEDELLSSDEEEEIDGDEEEEIDDDDANDDAEQKQNLKKGKQKATSS